MYGDAERHDMDDPSCAAPRARRRPGQLSTGVWTVLQTAGRPLTAHQVRGPLVRRPAYTTMVTTLARFHRQGILSRARVGRSHRYAPSTTGAGLAARRMRHALDGHGNRYAVPSHLVSALSGHDESVLHALLGDDAGPDREGRD